MVQKMKATQNNFHFDGCIHVGPYHYSPKYIPKLVLYILIQVLLISNHYIMIYIPPGPVFQREFNSDV